MFTVIMSNLRGLQESELPSGAKSQAAFFFFSSSVCSKVIVRSKYSYWTLFFYLLGDSYTLHSPDERWPSSRLFVPRCHVVLLHRAVRHSRTFTVTEIQPTVTKSTQPSNLDIPELRLSLMPICTDIRSTRRSRHRDSVCVSIAQICTRQILCCSVLCLFFFVFTV